MKTVAEYGDGDEAQDKARLIYTSNRALNDVYYHLPVTRNVQFYARPYKPITYHKEIHYNGKGPLTFYTQGKSYSMKVMGKGNYSILDGGIQNAYEFDTGRETKLIRGFISKGGFIRFWGGFSYTVFDFSIYDDIASAQIEDIPDGASRAIYDLRKICGDFLSFSSAPTDRYGRAIENCTLRDGRLEMDSDYSGEINLTYNRLPAQILGVTMEEDLREETIDITEEYVPLFIYLIWYHHWCNTDETKAALYKKKFEDLLDLIKERQRVFNSSYVDVNGWA